MLQALTDYGDLAVVLPAWLAVVTGLALGRWRGAAWAWLVVVTAVLGLTLTLKLVLIGSGALASSGLRSPSGHTVSAALFGGGLAGLAVATWRQPVLAAAFAAAIAGAAVGVTRVALGSHSAEEVLLALAIGVSGASVLAWWQGLAPHGARTWPALALGVAAALAFHGTHLQAETAIARLAGADAAGFETVPASPALTFVERAWASRWN